MPKVSALMPLFNGKTFIKESLESVQKQTFTDWEFIIVNDFGSDDGCAEIVQQYAEKDSRIILVQAEKRLGLAASLNVGLDMARGEYIARVDVDDPSEPVRFEKQVAYMDEHPEVSVCGVWQRSITPQKSNVQKVAYEPEELKAAMLFGCEISHCGVMLRKKDFDVHGWRYDPNYLGEDYELWKRLLMDGAVMVNIPEPLVSHRWGFGNISIAKGQRLVEEVREVNARMFRHLGINTDQYFPELFSGWRNWPEGFAKNNKEIFLQQGYQLLSDIYEKNKVAGYCDPQALHKILFYRWDWIRESCGIDFAEHKYEGFQNIKTTPIVSVVLPTFCSAIDISRAIDCIQAQTYTDWELLVINDFDSDDGTAEIVQMYGWNDPRVHLIQAERRLGLAESLNWGMREANGKYIARLDADDTSVPERFEKQVQFLEEHPEVGICGAWQHHYGKNCDWVHKAAPDPKEQRCRLLFWCDLCHSTLMLRRNSFIDNNLFYDPNAQAEDFDLWTRAMEFMEIANIPEVLGDYREGTGITANKITALATESGLITARTIRHILDIDLPIYDCYLLNGWINPIHSAKNQQKELERLKSILYSIWERNFEIKFFDQKKLLEILAAKWHWAKDNIDWKSYDYSQVKRIEDVFSDTCKPSIIARYKLFRERNPQFFIRVKKIIKRLFLRPIAQLGKHITNILFSDVMYEINKCTEGWTWDRLCRLNAQADSRIREFEQAFQKKMDARIWKAEQVSIQNAELIASLSFQQNLINYTKNEKIRIVFLFQVASFWTSMESFYIAVKKDERFDVKLVCYDEDIDYTIKTDTARKYLEMNNIDYIPYEIFNIDEFSPHIVVLQTPYDTNRTDKYKTINLRANGHRVIYIPYGIEIAATEHANADHFCNSVVTGCWRMYTLSDVMKKNYIQHCKNSKAVQALGLPRFDPLFHRDYFSLCEDVKRCAQGRKIVLWKVHFPKIITENGNNILVTPYISEYIKFAKMLSQYSDFFFIFMPHPRFLEFNEDKKIRTELERLYKILNSAKNVYIDNEDDYRNALVNSDYIIVDRSAVMVEAGSLGVPVFYMYNPDYKEPMAEAIEPLIESYYQGTSCADMENYLEMCRLGQDPKKEARESAFHLCVPYFDGKCGERIKEDIVHALMDEKSGIAKQYLIERYDELSARIEELEMVIANL